MKVTYMKKWWLEKDIVNSDGSILTFVGWICTTHECNSKEEIPNSISGDFNGLFDSDGFHGTFTLDDPSVQENNENNYTILYEARLKEISSTFDKSLYKNGWIPGELIATSFPEFTGRIEDCIVENNCIIETLIDGFYNLDSAIEYDTTFKPEPYKIKLINIKNMFKEIDNIEYSINSFFCKAYCNKFDTSIRYLFNRAVYLIALISIISYEKIDDNTYKKLINTNGLNKYVVDLYNRDNLNYEDIMKLTYSRRGIRAFYSVDSILDENFPCNEIIKILRNLITDTRSYFSKNFNPENII